MKFPNEKFSNIQYYPYIEVMDILKNKKIEFVATSSLIGEESGDRFTINGNVLTISHDIQRLGDLLFNPRVAVNDNPNIICVAVVIGGVRIYESRNLNFDDIFTERNPIISLAIQYQQIRLEVDIVVDPFTIVSRKFEKPKGIRFTYDWGYLNHGLRTQIAQESHYLKIPDNGIIIEKGMARLEKDVSLSSKVFRKNIFNKTSTKNMICFTKNNLNIDGDQVNVSCIVPVDCHAIHSVQCVPFLNKNKTNKNIKRKITIGEITVEEVEINKPTVFTKENNIPLRLCYLNQIEISIIFPSNLLSVLKDPKSFVMFSYVPVIFDIDKLEDSGKIHSRKINNHDFMYIKNGIASLQA